MDLVLNPPLPLTSCVSSIRLNLSGGYCCMTNHPTAYWHEFWERKREREWEWKSNRPRFWWEELQSHVVKAMNRRVWIEANIPCYLTSLWLSLLFYKMGIISLISCDVLVLCVLLGDGQSVVATRVGTGQVWENKINYTHRSYRERGSCKGSAREWAQPVRQGAERVRIHG